MNSKYMRKNDIILFVFYVLFIIIYRTSCSYKPRNLSLLLIFSFSNNIDYASYLCFCLSEALLSDVTVVSTGILSPQHLELTRLTGIKEELFLSVYSRSMLILHSCFSCASQESYVIYITSPFVYSVWATISGLQRFSRNRQKSKYLITWFKFSSFCIFVIPLLHYFLSSLNISPEQLHKV